MWCLGDHGEQSRCKPAHKNHIVWGWGNDPSQKGTVVLTALGGRVWSGTFPEGERGQLHEEEGLSKKSPSWEPLHDSGTRLSWAW